MWWTNVYGAVIAVFIVFANMTENGVWKIYLWQKITSNGENGILKKNTHLGGKGESNNQV